MRPTSDPGLIYEDFPALASDHMDNTEEIILVDMLLSNTCLPLHQQTMIRTILTAFLAIFALCVPLLDLCQLQTLPDAAQEDKRC